jgi:hypothetical protein
VRDLAWETSRNAPPVCAQDPSLRLKSGCGQDDAEEMKTVEPQTAPLPIFRLWVVIRNHYQFSRALEIQVQAG